MTVPIDLLAGFIVIVCLSVALFILGMRIGYRTRRRIWASIAAACAASLMIYALWLNDSPILTHVLPIADVLMWGNVQLPIAGLLGGSRGKPQDAGVAEVAAARRSAFDWFVAAGGSADRPIPAGWAIAVDARRLPADVNVLLLARRCRDVARSVWNSSDRSGDDPGLPDTC